MVSFDTNDFLKILHNVLFRKILLTLIRALYHDSSIVYIKCPEEVHFYD